MCGRFGSCSFHGFRPCRVSHDASGYDVCDETVAVNVVEPD